MSPDCWVIADTGFVWAWLWSIQASESRMTASPTSLGSVGAAKGSCPSSWPARRYTFAVRVKRTSDAVRPHAIVGQYVNFLGHEQGDSYQKALAGYGEAKLDRLIALKRRYDPENLFRINHNIPLVR